MFRFQCPACKKRLKAPEDKAGAKISCPQCGHPQRIPRPPTAPPVAKPPTRGGAVGPTPDWLSHPQPTGQAAATSRSAPNPPPPMPIAAPVRFEPVTASAPERVIFEGTWHPWLFAAPTTILLIGILVTKGVAWRLPDTAGSILRVCGLLLVLIGMLDLTRRLVLSLTSVFQLTTRRMVLKGGLIARRSVEAPHNQGAILTVRQGPLGQLLSFGLIRVSFQGRRAEYSPIAQPAEFRRRWLALQSNAPSA